jgi:hypothetical protein
MTRSAKPGSSGCDELLDSTLEPFLDLDHLGPVRCSANRTKGGEGRICQHHQLGIARHELHAEPGSFRAGTQLIGRSGAAPMSYQLTGTQRQIGGSYDLGSSPSVTSAGVPGCDRAPRPSAWLVLACRHDVVAHPA